jgi:hypothetical protein
MSQHASAQVRRHCLTAIAAAILVVLAGCTATRESSRAHRLSEDEALQLAVTLANQTCQAKFARAPFDAKTSSVRFVDGRWTWGGVDPGGPEGLSAEVSFDEFGAHRHVEVFLSTDAL